MCHLDFFLIYIRQKHVGILYRSCWHFIVFGCSSFLYFSKNASQGMNLPRLLRPFCAVSVFSFQFGAADITSQANELRRKYSKSGAEAIAFYKNNNNVRWKLPLILKAFSIVCRRSVAHSVGYSWFFSYLYNSDFFFIFVCLFVYLVTFSLFVTTTRFHMFISFSYHGDDFSIVIFCFAFN